jgi:DNA invertase Pin-like site-specific DNA recombinase
VRISKDDLADGGTREAKVANHLRECREFIADQDWDLVEEFVDPNVSASRYSKKPRPEYERMFRWILTDTGEPPLYLVSTEMERIHRRMDHFDQLIKLADPPTTTLRKIICTNDEVYDLSTANGIHAAWASVNNAQRESKRASERQRRRMRRRAVEGRSQGKAPFGYRLEETGEYVSGRPVRRQVIVQEEADLIRDAANRVLAGASIRSIQLDWHAKGVRTRPTSRTPQGLPYDHVDIRRTLINAHYAGWRVHRPVDAADPKSSHPEDPGDQHEGTWEPILDNETHIALRELLLAEGRKPFQGAVRTHLLTGILYCGVCGAKMRAQTEKAPRRTYYKCPPAPDGRLCLGRAEAPLNQLVKNYVVHWLRAGGPYADYLAKARPHDAAVTEKLGQLRRIEHQLGRQIEETQASRRLPRDDPEYRTPKEVREDVNYLQAERREISNQIHRLVNRHQATDTVLRVGMTAEQWDDLTLAQKREHVERLFDRITVYRTQRGRLQFDPSKVTVEAGAWAGDIAKDALIVPIQEARPLRRELVHAYLQDHSGEIVSPAMIAAATGIDVGHVSFVLKELPAGMVEVVQQGAGRRPWLYRLNKETASCDVA